MAKDAEKKYFANMTEELRAYLALKPFSDEQRGSYLIDIGQILSLIRKPPARLLDLGCGSGWTSAMFALSGYDVFGVDIAFGAIQLARETFPLERLRFAVMD